MNKPRVYGRLLLVPAPLDFGVSSGNPPIDLQELLPLGVIRQAAGLSHWLVENAKSARAFLRRVDAIVSLSKPLQAIDIVELPRESKAKFVTRTVDIDALLAPAIQGHDIGLVSEAGLPAVADPGAALVRAAHRLGLSVIPLPGASALALALAASGLNGQSFVFLGYLPVDASQRIASIRNIERVSQSTGQTQLMIEVPYRNHTLLTALLLHLKPASRLSVSCGLTLSDGWTRSDTVAGWKARTVTLPTDIPAVFAVLGPVDIQIAPAPGYPRVRG